MLFVQFTLGTERYLLDAAQIERMLSLTPLKSLPGVPAWVAGLFEFDGAPVPVIDLCALALGRRSRERLSTRLALVHYRSATEATDATHQGGRARLLGILLEQATRTVTLERSAFHDAGIETPHARYLGPVARDAAGLLQWVRIEHLLPPAVQAQLFAASPA